MSKSDNDFINTNQDYELNDWLARNGYRETDANRTELRKIILDLKGGNSSKNLTWKELDDALANQPSKFKNLEKK
ncbi:hypothetical protein ACT3RU_17235 [Halomonas sp. TP35]